MAAIAALLGSVQAFSTTGMSQRKSLSLNSAVLDEVKETTVESGSLPPFLQDMADERREFELNLGKAMDTLRKDYPNMLHKTPGKKGESLILNVYPRQIPLTVLSL